MKIITVPPHGPSPCPILFVGESGQEEAFHKPFPQPFVGKAGREQDPVSAPIQLIIQVVPPGQCDPLVYSRQPQSNTGTNLRLYSFPDPGDVSDKP